ncbi:MAG: response regulator [Proteobacteria bacterium]|nr:response regulator [Pseudomonadota bacterium]
MPTRQSPRPEPAAAAALDAALAGCVAWAEALAQWHAVRGVHGGLRPALFAVAPGGGLHLLPPGDEIDLERLRYQAPEQLGRVEAAEPASDLYALGAMMYERLAGQPPFDAADPLALCHDHAAVAPPRLQTRRAGVPPVLADLVHKLLEKLPAARYASAKGLLHDLRGCQQAWLARRAIEPFALGQVDRGSQFRLPDRLYGRDAEIALLGRIYDRAVRGEIVLCMVGGYSGIGKSTLVRAMRPHVVASGGSLVEGKFDQYHRETPYTALIEAFKSLLRQVLAKPRDELAQWRGAVERTLGENASVVIDVLPELQRLIGPKPAAPLLTGSAAQQRFNAVFSQLLRLFASERHPLVMFLDDLQWADFASLALIRTFVREGVGAHLLMVGAYRDNEVDAAHPMMHLLEDLRREGAQIVELAVGPLAVPHVAALVADSCVAIDDPAGLAALVVHKTEGNPFFTRQFLATMVRQGDLAYDEAAGRWRWQLDAVRLHDAADNVVELMMRRLALLPADSQAALKIGACIGKRFGLELLAQVAGRDAARALADLAPALQDELLLPVSEAAGQREFQFAHDRVQQAAYAVAAGGEAAAVHLRIGRAMRQGTPAERLDAEVFGIVDQFNQALAGLADAAERLAVAQLNQRAAQRAKGAMAYAAAASYLHNGLQLLPADAWTASYAAAYDMHLLLAEVQSVLNREQPFQATVRALLAHAGSAADRLAVRIVQTAHLCLSSRMHEGLDVGCEGLAEVGIALPAPADRAALTQAFEQALADFRERTRAVDLAPHLYALPPAADALSEKIMRLIGAMADAATITNTPLLSLLAVVGANRSLAFGNTLLSPLLYTLLGQGMIAHEGAYLEGRRLAEVAMRLSDEKLLDLWSFGRSRVHQFWFIMHWSRHIEASLPQVEEALAVTRRAHDPLYAAYLLNIIAITHYHLGRSTADVLAAHQRVVEHCKPYSMDVIVGFTQCYAGAAAALRGETAALTAIGGAHVDEARFRERFHDMPMVMGLALGARVPLLGLAGDWEAVLDAAADPDLAASPPFLPHVVIDFWRALACVNLLPHAPAERRALLQADFQAARGRLERIRTRAAPDNVAHRLALLDAEWARIRPAPADAVSALYRSAARRAEEAGYVLEQGYALERLADWLAREGGAAAEALRAALQGAGVLYARAQAPVLARRVAAMLRALAPPGADAGAPTPRLDEIDTLAVLRAVQAISSETDLQRLLGRLMKLIIDVSGAERGAVLLRPDDADHAVVELPLGMAADDALPRSLLRYVMNSAETQVLDRPGQAHAEGVVGEFDDDPYFSARRPASALCLALGRRVPVRRVLYLEHGSLPRVFSAPKLTVLGWLAAQAAISIENAELYGNLELKVAERTSALTEANQRLRRQQAELAQAKAEAEQAAASKAAFLANMSHEIRTPMNAILGMSHLALQLELSDKARNYIVKVHRSAENLLGIINEILDISKIEAGKLQLEELAFPLDGVLDHLATLVGFKAADRGLKLHFDVDEQLPAVLIGDPLRLGQVLLNLCNNAIKFTETGHVVVGVRLWAHQPEPGAPAEPQPAYELLRFWVQDTGIGLTREQIGRLFESFTQADDSVTRRYGGSGLGLTICQRLVEAMHGRIWVESEPGRGTTFYFLARFGLPQGGEALRPMLSAAELAGKRVLIVDDSAIAREILQQLCLRLGLLAATEGDGQAALARIVRAAEGTAEGTGQGTAADEAPFDLVLMDWKMPLLDGKECTRRLQQRLGERAPPVVLVTAYGHGEILESEGARFQGLLQKPVTASSFLEVVGRALSLPATVIDAAAAAAAAPSLPPLPAVAAPERLHGARVLLVEDNEMNRELAVDLLASAGVEVVCAEHGQEALQRLSHDGAFDLVLMDCQMPVMDGYRATEAIRAHPAWRHLPVIAMTANAMPSDSQRALAAGMNDHIAKPIRVDAMYATLVRWLPVREAAAVVAPAPPAAAAADDRDGVPAALPGIDVQRGLKHCVGRPAVYRRSLMLFRKGALSFEAQFRAAQQAGDRPLMIRLAHTLKGNAGTIGAVATAAAAGHLESLCLQAAAPGPTDAALATTCAALAPVLAGLARFSAEADAAAAAAVAPPPAVDPQAIEALQQRLRECIAAFDPAALEAARQLRQWAADARQRAAAERLVEALARYDFERAAALLDGAA